MTDSLLASLRALAPCVVLCAASIVPIESACAADGDSALPAAYDEKLPGTRVTIGMVPIPPAEGKPGFWMARCEITWDAFDLFVFGIDGARDREGDTVDAYTRPSKPYIPPDRGFGHDGYPVISASYRSAKQFCRWLSAKTGHTYRLPTVDEWRHAEAPGIRSGTMPRASASSPGSRGTPTGRRIRSGRRSRTRGGSTTCSATPASGVSR